MGRIAQNICSVNQKCPSTCQRNTQVEIIWVTWTPNCSEQATTAEKLSPTSISKFPILLLFILKSSVEVDYRALPFHLSSWAFSRCYCVILSRGFIQSSMSSPRNWHNIDVPRKMHIPGCCIWICWVYNSSRHYQRLSQAPPWPVSRKKSSKTQSEEDKLSSPECKNKREAVDSKVHLVHRGCCNPSWSKWINPW